MLSRSSAYTILIFFLTCEWLTLWLKVWQKKNKKKKNSGFNSYSYKFIWTDGKPNNSLQYSTPTKVAHAGANSGLKRRYQFSKESGIIKITSPVFCYIFFKVQLLLSYVDLKVVMNSNSNPCHPWLMLISKWS